MSQTYTRAIFDILFLNLKLLLIIYIKDKTIVFLMGYTFIFLKLTQRIYLKKSLHCIVHCIKLLRSSDILIVWLLIEGYIHTCQT